MTVKELRTILAGLPDDMLVRYVYDTGYGYPTFAQALIVRSNRELGTNGQRNSVPDGQTFVLLNEDRFVLPAEIYDYDIVALPSEIKR